MIREFALEHIGPGWKLESTKRHFAGDAYSPEPIGGTVVEVLPAWTDLETGELTPARYRCLATWRPQDPWQFLTAEEVDLDRLYGVDRQAAETGALWCIRAAVHRPRGSRSDRLADVERIHDAWRLAAAWAGIR